MEKLKGELPEIQKQANVEKIVPEGKADPKAETVDVTAKLVGLCKPTPETLKRSLASTTSIAVIWFIVKVPVLSVLIALVGVRALKSGERLL